MIPVRILPEAAREFLDTIAFYNAIRSGLGNDFATAFQQAVESITRFPEAWPPYTKHSRRYILKRFPYAILYRNQPDCISTDLRFYRRAKR